MATIDPAKPWAEVHGVIGVRYEQAGRLFSGTGAEVRLIEDEKGEHVEIIGEPLGQPIIAKPDIAESAPESGLKDRHWREIKALVEINGGVWTNKQDGINFLEGKA